jgi:hypothetical protein
VNLSSAIGQELLATYTYGGTGYANPHAATQVGNGLSTSTFQFDNNGNVIQKLTDGVLTTYQWDYANRLIALGVGNASTTYGYDAFGARVLQIGTSTTNIYPVKWFSIALLAAASKRINLAENGLQQERGATVAPLGF